MAHAAAASAATGMDYCAGHVRPLASLLLSYSRTFNPIRKCTFLFIELGVNNSQRTLQTAFRHGAIYRGGCSRGLVCLPKCVYLQSICGHDARHHGWIEFPVSRPCPWLWLWAVVLPSLGLPATASARLPRACLFARLPRARESGALPGSAAPRTTGRGAAALRLAVPAHGRLAGSAAVSCCRDRVVSAGTVPRRAPRPPASRFRATGAMQ